MVPKNIKNIALCAHVFGQRRCQKKTHCFTYIYYLAPPPTTIGMIPTRFQEMNDVQQSALTWNNTKVYGVQQMHADINIVYYEHCYYSRLLLVFERRPK